MSLRVLGRVDQAHDDSIWAVAVLMKNGKNMSLVSASADGEVKRWSFVDGIGDISCEAKTRLKIGGIHCISVMPDSELILVSSMLGHVALLNSSNLSVVKSNRFDSAVWTCVSSQSNAVYAATYAGSVMRLNRETLQVEAQIDAVALHFHPTCLACEHNADKSCGDRLWLGSSGGRILVVNASLQVLFSSQPHGDAVRCIAVESRVGHGSVPPAAAGAQNSKVVSVGDDGRVVLIDTTGTFSVKLLVRLEKTFLFAVAIPPRTPMIVVSYVCFVFCNMISFSIADLTRVMLTFRTLCVCC
jgi:WD40 repeat protein